MLQRKVGRGVIAGLVEKRLLTGLRLDDREKIRDLLVTTLRSLCDHLANIGFPVMFAEFSRSF